MKLQALLACSAVAIVLAPTVLRADIDRLKDAQEVVTDMAGSKDEGIPVDLIEQAKCLAIIPGVKKAAVGIGGEYGRGYLVCRRADGKKWSAPGAVRIEGGSFGFQIGGAETDVIMIVRNDRGVDRLLSNKFTVGADAAVAAGPVGRRAAAQTDATMRAEILAWSHSRGAFAGVALQGATLREDDSENKELYGREMSNRDIVKGDVPVPTGAEGLIAVLSKY